MSQEMVHNRLYSALLCIAPLLILCKSLTLACECENKINHCTVLQGLWLVCTLWGTICNQNPLPSPPSPYLVNQKTPHNLCGCLLYVDIFDHLSWCPFQYLQNETEILPEYSLYNHRRFQQSHFFFQLVLISRLLFAVITSQMHYPVNNFST